MLQASKHCSADLEVFALQAVNHEANDADDPDAAEHMAGVQN
ncbi:MAG: hypothetical protein ACRERX_10790 [Pseudomonas sp.]